MKLILNRSTRSRQERQAFTMVEVALSLAIIAFAIVAVIGILPTGMQVQRENRQQTIINQDGQFILEVIQNGLTNATLLAENLEWIESYTNGMLEGRFTRADLINGVRTTNELAYRITGLLSTPRFVPDTNAPSGYISNYVRAKFVGNSGPLADRLTEDPVTRTRDLAFGYLVTVDIAPMVLSSSYQANAGNAMAAAVQTNLYSLRVNMSWPVYSTNSVGNGRRSFNTVVAGKLERDTNFLYRFRPNEFTGI